MAYTAYRRAVTTRQTVAPTVPRAIDEDDLWLTIKKGHWHYHFYEWYAAIHIFQRSGAISMVEKYAYPRHRRKFKQYTSVLSQSQRDELDSIRRQFDNVQLPDLLVLPRDGSRLWFAEIKGRDGLSEKQVGCIEAIRSRLRIRVEVMRVKLIDLKPTESAI